MNYGCTAPTVPNAAVAKFTNNVNAAKNTANNQIDSIKVQKKQNYDAEMARRAIEEAAKRAAEKQKEMPKTEQNNTHKSRKSNPAKKYQYGSIMYNGVEYPIYVPNHLITSISAPWKTIYSKTEHDFNFDWV